MDHRDGNHSQSHFQFGKRQGYTKIYLGQLPLDITERDLKDAFGSLAQIEVCRIVKGNDKGQFMRYCYSFLEVKGDQDFTNEVIRKVSHNNPGWRINIRADYERAQGRPEPPRGNYEPRYDNRMREPQAYSNPHSNPQPNQYPSRDREREQPTNPNGMNIPYMQPNFNNRLINYSQGERGIKKYRILVREIWIGGIPENISQHDMREIMSTFGIVESTEIFPKFAFVKYKLVNDATTAFEKASVIHQKFGKSPGFRIFFSDPEKRIQIVSNHYEFDRQSEYLPILFLGFPPVTSSFVDDTYMKSVGEQFGPIVETYMRKSNNPQTRSYILLTYDSVKNAIRAKQELSRRKDLLGDKRVEVAVLLAEEPILRGRNFETTIQRFQAPNNYQKRNKSGPAYNNNSFQSQVPMYSQYPPQYQQQPQHGYNNRSMPMPMPPQMMMPPNMQPPMGGMGMPPNMGGMGSMPPMGGMPPGMMPYYSNVPMYYPPYNMQPSFVASETDKDQVVKIIETALNKSGDPRAIQAPVSDHHDKDNKSPDWSGYLTRNKVPKVGADGYSRAQTFNFDDSSINIAYLIKLPDMKFKNKKYILVLQATDQSSQKHFQGYIEFLSKKESAGVCLSYKELIYVIPKCEQADAITEMTDNQLLVVMEDVSLYHEVKDKLGKVQE